MAKSLFSKCFKRPQRKKHRTLKQVYSIKFAAYETSKKHVKCIKEIIDNWQFLDFNEEVTDRRYVADYNKVYKLPVRTMNVINEANELSDNRIKRLK
jgi:DNA gyrase/topoisomerase IV subunit A